MSTSRQSRSNRKNVTPSAAKATAVPAPVAAVEPPTAVGTPYSWTHDYDYVKKDLRKLGLVSTVLFAAIIIAGFFL